MSKYFIQIPALLKPEEMLQLDALLSTMEFIDGKATARMAAKNVKNNLQASVDSDNLLQVRNIISGALSTSPLFNIAALPKNIIRR